MSSTAKTKKNRQGELQRVTIQRPILRNNFKEISVKNILLLVLSFALSGCLGMPETVTPVDDFKLQNYLGKWYEIARLITPLKKD